MGGFIFRGFEMDISGIMGFALMICMTLLVYKIKVSLGILFMTLPVIAGFLSGFSMAEMSLYILKGIENVIPVALMFATAILFFGILNETGTFTAIITKIAGRFHLTRKNIFLMTVFVSAIAHLSGSGAVSYLIVITTCKSIYNENKIPLTNLMCLSSLTFGVMNMLPWAGPSGRLAGVLNTDPVSIWRLCIPSQIFGILMVCVIACILSNYQKLSDIDSLSENNCKQCIARNKPILIQQSRKKRCLSVGIMTIIIILLIITRISSWIVFMMGLSVISIINLKEVKKMELMKYIKSAGIMAGTVLASGVMVGVLTQSSMLTSMSEMISGLLPVSMREHIHILLGVLANPISWIMSGEVEIFGFMPIAAKIASECQIAVEVTAAAFLIPYSAVIFVLPMTVSVHLGLSLCGVSLREHIRQTYLWTLFLSITMLGFAIIIGILPY